MSITTIFYIFQTRTDTLCVRVSFLYMPRLEEHQRKNGSVDKYWGDWNKKHKKQPFGEAKRIKTTRLRRKTNLQKSDYPKAQIKWYPNPFYMTGSMIYVSHNRRHHNVGTCLWHVSNALIFCLKRNMPKACPYAMALSFWHSHLPIQGFFAVKRRAVFILGAKKIAPIGFGVQ